MDWDDNSNQNNKQISIESPENVEMGGKILSIRVCSKPTWKTVLRYISYLCSGFLVFLLQLWIPKFQTAITVSDSDLEIADSIVVYGAGNKINFLSLHMKIKTLRLFL